MPLANITLEPRIDPLIIAQVRQLESVRPGLLKHLVGVFDTKITQLFQDIPARLANNEIDALRIAFHTLKGTAASLGAQRLSYIAGLAESAAEGDTRAGELSEILKPLAEEFEAVRVELALIAQA
jgi:HPt (histidine-containing phosphotransfer) domain-containing protein